MSKCYSQTTRVPNTVPFYSYLEPVHKFSKQLVLGEDQALAVIQDADVCGANVIAVIDQPGVRESL